MLYPFSRTIFKKNKGLITTNIAIRTILEKLSAFNETCCMFPLQSFSLSIYKPVSFVPALAYTVTLTPLFSKPVTRLKRKVSEAVGKELTTSFTCIKNTRAIFLNKVLNKYSTLYFCSKHFLFRPGE